MIETLLLVRNKKHFSQAKGTPFTIPPLLEAYNYAATGATNTEILQMLICHPDINPTTRLVLQEISTTNLPTLEVKPLTPETLRKLYRKWNPRTTTSPSGWHLEHYFMMFPDKIPTQIQTNFWETHCNLLNFSIASGVIPSRWRKIITLMLLKDPANFNIQKLQVIHIIEADYNLLLRKSIAKDLAHHLETQKWFSPHQYGSRKGRTAHDAAANMALAHKFLHLTCTNAIEFNNNASACYDRIVPNMANLVAQRAGLNPKIAALQGTVLSNAHYHLKTAQGVLAGFYQHSETQPVYRTGQGATHSPITWAIISTVLFKIFHKMSLGLHLNSPSQKSQKLSIQGFVDDSVALAAHRVISTLFALAAQDTQLWANLLHSSGGKLELSKCFYFAIIWGFSKKGTPFLIPPPQDRKIQILDPLTQEQATIAQVSAYASRRYLGAYMSPSQSSKMQQTVTTKLAASFVHNIQNSTLTHAKTAKAYHAVYLPSITYPLRITPLSPSACCKVDAMTASAFVAHLGFPSSMP